MPKTCDHTSVGMFVWNNGKLLLIERGREPFGFAVPAGHVDGDASFEDAAKRELQEEVGLAAENMELVFEGRKENPCRREGGSWHYWRLYRVDASGEIERALDETKQARYFDILEIKDLASKTEKYTSGEISEEQWRQSPGLEPVMLEHFKELKII